MSDSTAGPRDAGPDAETMRRTYLFALKDAGGTVPPEIGVARRLAARGHNVVVLGDYSMAEQAAGELGRAVARDAADQSTLLGCAEW